MAASTPLLSQAFIERLRRLIWSLSRLRAGAGDRGGATRRPGGTHAFEGHRPYTPGDDPGQIDWNALGRTDHLVVKVFAREEEETVDLLLDGTASMGVGPMPSKDEAARRLAAALGFLALRSGHRLRLACLGGGATRLRGPFVGVESTAAWLRDLDGLPAPRGADAAAGIRSYLDQVRRPGAVVLFSDALEGSALGEVVAHLGDRAGEATFFHLLAPGEIRPDVEGPVLFTDAEDGGTLALEVGPDERRRYRQALEALRRGWHELGARHAVDYRPGSSADPLEVSVMDWYRARCAR